MAAALVAAGSQGLAASHVIASAAAPACATTDPGGGSWPSYGHDLANTRTQNAETTIGMGNVTNLGPTWKFTTSAAGGGNIETTPAVADGCLFVGTSSGRVVALNADTGELVWQTQVVSPSTPGFGGLIVGSPTVDSGRVIVAVNVVHAPFVIALDESNGSTLWTSQPVDSTADGPWGVAAGENASPTVWNGEVFLGFYGTETDPRARGGYVILDEATGRRLVHRYTISDANYALGYRGASVWATAVVDPATGYAYVGTANPGGTTAPGTKPSQYPECSATPAGQQCNAAIEDPNANAILKIDMVPTRATFGQIVGHYKGNPDNYFPGLYQTPLCDLLGNKVEFSTSPPAHAYSLPCLQIDLDFGASPNLFTSGGQTLVGELQKAGVYHAVRTTDMAKSWSTIVGLPCPACNAASTATNGAGIYGATAPGSLMTSLSPSGALRWVSPIGDAVHYQSTSTANGIAYTLDNLGFLDAFDTSTGLPLLRRSLSLDTGSVVDDVGSSGVAIARHTVYAADAGVIVAYQPNGVLLPTLPSLGGVGSTSTIVAGPGSFVAGYLTPNATTSPGGALDFRSLDVAPHNVTAFDPATGGPLIGPDTPACAAAGYPAGGCPVFFTQTISTGGDAVVQNTANLQHGRLYRFFCTVHPATMRGTLLVT